MKTLAIAIYVLAAAEVFKSFYLGWRIQMSTVTPTQALTDLTQLVSDLTTAVQNAATEFTALLTAIKNNNGVNPGAVDGLVNQGETMVASLNAAITAAQNALNPPPPPPVSISISPTSATLAPGATQQFSATVSNATNTGVTWSAQSGSIDPTGLYTAPSSPGTDTVTATSQQDTTKSVSASVTITS